MGGGDTNQPAHHLAVRCLTCGTWEGNWERITIGGGTSPREWTAIYRKLDEVRQSALDGKLPIWGAQYRHDNVVMPIEPAYWRQCGFEETTLLGDQADDFRTAEVDGLPRYYRLMTSKTKVEELWPNP